MSAGIPRFILLYALFTGVLWGEEFGLTPTETYALKQELGDEVFFLDVRDPVEIQFTGFTDVVDLNIPFLLVDRTGWSEGRNAFPMPRNPRFAEEVEAALLDRGLDRETRIVTMCRSGSARGEPSAAFLRENGFPNAYFVRHGFQGDVVSEGENAGFRRKNGWQNSGLPWGDELNPEKIYRSPKR